LQCNGLQPQQCASAGTGWSNLGAACTGSTPVCLNGACQQCTSGSVGCSGWQPQILLL
jgi:hypothetical protein